MVGEAEWWKCFSEQYLKNTKQKALWQFYTIACLLRYLIGAKNTDKLKLTTFCPSSSITVSSLFTKKAAFTCEEKQGWNSLHCGRELRNEAVPSYPRLVWSPVPQPRPVLCSLGKEILGDGSRWPLSCAWALPLPWAGSGCVCDHNSRRCTPAAVAWQEEMWGRWGHFRLLWDFPVVPVDVRGSVCDTLRQSLFYFTAVLRVSAATTVLHHKAFTS